jgi:hypothetical protein
MYEWIHRSYDHQVFWGVVELIAVAVMHDFTPLERAPELLFGSDAVGVFGVLTAFGAVNPSTGVSHGISSKKASHGVMSAMT